MLEDTDYLDLTNQPDSALDPELLKLKKDIQQFIKVNAKYWSLSTLSQFLGLDAETVQQLAKTDRYEYKFSSKTRHHTMLIVKPMSDVEYDRTLGLIDV